MKPVPIPRLTKEQEEKLALLDFLEGPDPETLSVSSVGTCSWCRNHGAGPAHNCSVWRVGRERIAAMKLKP